MEKILAYFLVFLVVLLTLPAAFAQPVNPCEADIARFCANLQPGGGAIADCLSKHEKELAPECREVHLAKLSGVLRDLQEFCKTDIVRFCGGESQHPDIRLLDCLRLNAPSLVPECRTKLYEAFDLLHY